MGGEEGEEDRVWRGGGGGHGVVIWGLWVGMRWEEEEAHRQFEVLRYIQLKYFMI